MQESNIAWFARKLGSQQGRERARDEAEYEDRLLMLGREHVGRELAAEMGLAERAAHFFVQGFAGVPAVLANPRAQNMEPIFRAGRKTLQEKGVAQRIRAAAAAIRAEWAFADFQAEKYHCRPVPYETSVRGIY